MRRALVIVLVLAGMFAGWTVRGFASTPSSSGNVRAVISFVGDSNIAHGARALAVALTYRNDPYAGVDLSRAGARVRMPDCPMFSPTCPTYNYWQARLADAATKIKTDLYVVNLGINDTLTAGTRVDGPGYTNYGQKIDWLMHLFNAKPVVWSTLPCALEPAELRVGCVAINREITAARTRWFNLTVLDWATVANSHPEYIVPGDVHYTDAGNTAYANLLVGVLDRKFPA